MPEWVIFAVVAGLFSNAFNILSRYFLKDDEDATAWAWLFELGRFIFFGAALFFDFSVKFSQELLILLFFVGITELLSVFFTMKMHAYSHISISTILSRMRMIWIPVIAFFLIREHLQLMDYIGIIILFIGISITVSPRKFFVDKGAMYANAGSVVLAMNSVLLKTVAPFASVSLIATFSAIPSVVLFPILMKKERKRIFTSVRKRFYLKILAIILHVISFYFFLFALRVGEVSKVNAIYQGMLITSVFAGIVFFKEREDIAKKLIGAAITLIGIFLLK